jgi:hypothetical protein
MWRWKRNAQGLRAALGVIGRLETITNEPALLNMAAAAKLVTAAALARKESRGGHWRTIILKPRKPASRTFMTLADAERIAAAVEASRAAPANDAGQLLCIHAAALGFADRAAVRAALEEDLGRAGDITSDLTIPADKQAAQAGGAQAGRIAGLICAEAALRLVDASVTFDVAAGRLGRGGRRASGHSLRSCPQHSHRRARGIELPGPLVRHRHLDRCLGQGGGRHKCAHCLHAKDAAGPA